MCSGAAVMLVGRDLVFLGGFVWHQGQRGFMGWWMRSEMVRLACLPKSVSLVLDEMRGRCTWEEDVLFFFFFLLWLIYSVVLVSAVQQRNSVIRIYTYLFNIPFHYA